MLLRSKTETSQKQLRFIQYINFVDLLIIEVEGEKAQRPFCFLRPSHAEKKGKREQSSCKPGSVLAGSNTMSRRPVLVIYLSCRSPDTSSLRCSVLPSASDEQPSDGSLHKLAAPKTHSHDVTTALVSPYLTFSPLPAGRRLFSSALLSHH